MGVFFVSDLYTFLKSSHTSIQKTAIRSSLEMIFLVFHCQKCHETETRYYTKDQSTQKNERFTLSQRQNPYFHTISEKNVYLAIFIQYDKIQLMA